MHPPTGRDRPRRLPAPLTLSDGGRRPRADRRRRGESLTAWGFVSPAVLIILGLSVVPLAWSLLLSFRADDLVTPGRWVGLDNYRALAQDPNFREAIRTTLLYAALFVPLSMVLGLALAVALNRRIRLVGLYRTLFFVPFVVSATAQGVLFSFILDPEFGAANAVLHALGVSPQGFLTDPGQALFVLVAISLWSGTGFCVVVYLAALQDVSPSLVDAARIDGAGRLQLLRHVTLPALRPVNMFLVLWQTIQALQVFDLVYVTTKGGPLGSTTVIVYFVWEQAFRNFTAGYGAAAAYVLAGALLVIRRGRASGPAPAAPRGGNRTMTATSLPPRAAPRLAETDGGASRGPLDRVPLGDGVPARSDRRGRARASRVEHDRTARVARRPDPRHRRGAGGAAVRSARGARARPAARRGARPRRRARPRPAGASDPFRRPRLRRVTGAGGPAMSLATTGDLVSAAAAAGCGVGAFNVVLLEQLEAVLAGAEAAGCPVIVQVSENAVAYRGGLGPLAAAAREAIAAAGAVAALHLDHATRPELVREAVDRGFASVMFDGSHLPWAENLDRTREIARWCHERGVWIEAELGAIGGKGGAHAPGVRTDPDAAARFVADTGVDALAVAVGTAHQMARGAARLDLDLIRALHAAVPVPLVLHGSSGVDDVALVAGVRAGIRKINMSTHLNTLFTDAARSHLAAQPAAVDPRRYLRPARARMAQEVARLLRLLRPLP